MSSLEVKVDQHGHEIERLRAWRHNTTPTLSVLKELAQNIPALADAAARKAINLAFAERDERAEAERERHERQSDRGWNRKEWAIGVLFGVVMIGLQIWSHF